MNNEAIGNELLSIRDIVRMDDGAKAHVMCVCIDELLTVLDRIARALEYERVDMDYLGHGRKGREESRNR